LIKGIGTKVLLVTGAGSFIKSAAGVSLLDQLMSQGFLVDHYSVDREPTPQLIDRAVLEYSSRKHNVVLAIGGGSVLDAGKAISAMLPLAEPVKDYLEGVGEKSHPGSKIPFIAVPTTAGTGSEATKNAVLSETGVNGYKRSLRHDNFVPDIALIDPVLSISCSPSTTAASGMDAFTQLMESYLSTAANPLTDAYARQGLNLVSRSLLKVYREGADVGARADMSLAAYLSGVALANAGLGLVHGFASSIGGYFEIPHGVICSAMMAPANKLTVQKLRSEKNNVALNKYASVGKIFSTDDNKSGDYYIDSLLALIESLTRELNIPKLGTLGVSSSDHDRIATITDNKNNPVKHDKQEILQILALA
jgi:alcohol dehydrogenase class IV